MQTRKLRFPLFLLVLLLAVGAASPAGVRAAALPDVDIVVIADVYDGPDWLAMYQETLATPPGAGKVLRVTLPARTGGSRSIDIEQPKVTVAVVVASGKPLVKATIAGKVSSALALGVVTPFQQAAMEIQAGWLTNEIHLTYGLSVVPARLVELYFDRP